MSAKTFMKKLVSPMLWGNLLAMLVVVVALCFGVKCWLNYYTHHGEGVDVPDLYGVNYRTAIARLDSLGLLLVVNDSSYIEGMAAGDIVSQTPGVGMQVKDGRIIYVTINSLTMPCERIPDLIDNCSYREAQARLKSLGFELLSPKVIEGEKDWVYGIQFRGRNLVAGEGVPRGSELTLVIGSGKMDDELDEEDIEDILKSPDEPAEGEADDVDDFLEVTED
ncbi:MAG: PASTA domain-containing protein [Prevotella sp.]|nr:PASTA domain-containing protein [Prevotella sp.]